MDVSICLVEVVATYVENSVILASVICSSGNKYTGKKHLFLLILFSVFTTLIVGVMNRIHAFSYVTPLVSMAFVIFVSSRLMSNGQLVLRSTSAVLAYLIIQSIDYIIVIILGHITGKYEDFFNVFVTAEGVNRTAFLIIDKSVDFILFCLFRSCLSRLSKLTTRLQTYLFILSSASYIIMQFLFQVVLVPNLSVMQLAVVASWCFLLGFIVAFIAFFLALTKQEQDRQRMEMLRAENALMAENYKSLHAAQQASLRTLHDFRHHVRTVHELISGGKVESALEYADSLLKTSYHQAAQCHSGNDIVDAIINSKLAEAQVKKIQFTYMANLHIPIQIDPVDLCGVLANQLENAFEASMQIPDPAGRIVHTEVKQVQSFVILRVENTVLSDPFTDNPDLHTTKSDPAIPHGYGLLNIRSIAQKYEGTLRTEFSNNRFISVVSLSDLPFDTNNSTVG